MNVVLFFNNNRTRLSLAALSANACLRKLVSSAATPEKLIAATFSFMDRRFANSLNADDQLSLLCLRPVVAIREAGRESDSALHQAH